jgi:hypothetical protein
MTVPVQETLPLLLCLCRSPEDDWKIVPAYLEAFRRRGYEVLCVGGDIPLDTPIDDIFRNCPRLPVAVLHFVTALPLLPDGLAQCGVPTVCFHPDTYAFTDRRLRWSFLFDHAAVFHPGYETLFQKGGHPGAFLLPYAVRREHFDLPEIDRVFEIGWVGQSSGPIYQRRARLLPLLAQSFWTNEWRKSYSLEEVAVVYRSSRIVVNIGRDDFPQDANMRVFEVLASGALLITSLPTELSKLGFQDGVHFVGYSNDEEIIPLVRSFLRRESDRVRIANAGRAKVLQEHTYDERISTLLSRLEQYSGRKPAPARGWSEARARLAALDFFVGHQVMDCALRQYLSLCGRDFRGTWEGGWLLARGFAKRVAHAFAMARKNSVRAARRMRQDEKGTCQEPPN